MLGSIYQVLLQLGSVLNIKYLHIKNKQVIALSYQRWRYKACC